MYVMWEVNVSLRTFHSVKCLCWDEPNYKMALMCGGYKAYLQWVRLHLDYELIQLNTLSKLAGLNGLPKVLEAL